MTGDRCDFQVPPAIPRLVWHPLRDREQSCILERSRLGGISCSCLCAINEGFRHERGGLRLGEITTGFDPAMKFAAVRPYADPEATARKLIEIANSVEAVQDGRIHIELLNGPILFEPKATPAEYTAGLKQAIDRGWLQMHESGTYVKFTQAGAELFA